MLYMRHDQQDGRVSFGRCCACGEVKPDVRNFITLNRPAPVPGTGWGCYVCGLDLNGALAVVCDSCLERNAAIKWVIYGQAWRGERILLSECPDGEFHHRMSYHSEVQG